VRAANVPTALAASAAAVRAAAARAAISPALANSPATPATPGSTSAVVVAQTTPAVPAAPAHIVAPTNPAALAAAAPFLQAAPPPSIPLPLRPPPTPPPPVLPPLRPALLLVRVIALPESTSTEETMPGDTVSAAGQDRSTAWEEDPWTALEADPFTASDNPSEGVGQAALAMELSTLQSTKDPSTAPLTLAAAAPGMVATLGDGCNAGAIAPLLHAGVVSDSLAVGPLLQPMGAGTSGASAFPLHADAVFDSLLGFTEAVAQAQEHGPQVVLHKKRCISTHGAYICRETHQVIRREGFAVAKGDHGAKDRQWWRHVCAGACGVVAQVKHAGGQDQPTKLSEVMQVSSTSYTRYEREGLLGQGEGMFCTFAYRARGGSHESFLV
jgi:hypothetical protein